MDFEFRVELSKEAPTESYAGDSDIDVQMVHNDAVSNQTSMQIESVPGENVETPYSGRRERNVLCSWNYEEFKRWI